MRFRFSIGLLACIYLSPCLSQRAADTLHSFTKPLVVEPVQHAAMILRYGDLTIYNDPYGGPELFHQKAAPVIILISDVHQDHVHAETLNGLDLSKLELVVAPQAVLGSLPAGLAAKTKTLANGQSLRHAGILISAVPMYNLPETEDSKHPKGRGNGYLLELDHKTIYISGDTEDIPEMRELRHVDLAFVCMNLPYTMDVDQAASAVAEFKPSVVYPYHYRGKDGLSDLAAFKKLVNEKDPSIDVRIRDWYGKNGQ